MSAQRRWMRFNLVGIMGFSLQMVTLWALVRWAGASAGVAVTLAVLAALSHNFVWHERFTWRGLPREHRLTRWLSFHLSTGTVSLVTNVGVTLILMNVMGFSMVPANIMAVAIGSLVNFWINDRLIFRSAPVLETRADVRRPGNVV